MEVNEKNKNAVASMSWENEQEKVYYGTDSLSCILREQPWLVWILK